MEREESQSEPPQARNRVPDAVIVFGDDRGIAVLDENPMEVPINED